MLANIRIRKIYRLVSRLILLSILLIAIFYIDSNLRPPAVQIGHAIWLDKTLDTNGFRLKLAAEGSIPLPDGAKTVHASNLLVMPSLSPASLMAFWFAGDYESAPNVQIAASQFDRKTQTWSTASYVANREQMGQELGFAVRRIGNPVSWLDSTGRIHLFVVTTGLGGWAASRISHLVQSSPTNNLSDLKFKSQGVLPLSWLWNVSFLVRNAPLALDDGGMVLPVYFELGIKYPVALRFDNLGNFAGIARISRKSGSLQPTLIMQSPTQWTALMRNGTSGGKIEVARTLDSGLSWQDQEELKLTNPDSAIAAIAIGRKQFYLVHNPSLGSRGELDLSFSEDGRNWSRINEIRQGVALDEFSYPALAWTDGSLWITYTNQRHSISWQRYESLQNVSKERP